jgi:hypothetical protein
MSGIRKVWVTLLTLLAAVIMVSAPAAAQQQQKQKPNILVIMADDIGYWNISAYNRGMMGYVAVQVNREAIVTLK